MGGRVSRFRVGREGGHIITDRNNFWIALAPYFFPLYSLITIAIYGLLSLFFNMQPYGRLLYALIGVTWAFHLTFTCWMILKNQTDLSDQGTFFSRRDHLFAEPDRAQRHARDRFAANFVCRFWRRYLHQYRQLFALDCHAYRSFQSWRTVSLTRVVILSASEGTRDAGLRLPTSFARSLAFARDDNAGGASRLQRICINRERKRMHRI